MPQRLPRMNLICCRGRMPIVEAPLEPNPDRSPGCEHCWQDSADATWHSRSQLEQRAELIDESHFHVTVLACTRCGQSFLSVFSELIDWGQGDDSQAWTLLPITESEAASLKAAGARLQEAALYETWSERRSLRRMRGTGNSPTNVWARGVGRFPHD